MRASLLSSVVLVSWGLVACPHDARAQFDRPLAGEVAERKIDQLRSDDAVLRTEINNAQIARQVEITRLEGRIIQLEEQLRAVPRDTGSAQLAFVLGLAETSGVHQAVNREPGVEEETATAATETKPTDDVPKEKPPEAGQSLVAASAREIVVRDFMLALEIELLDAQSRLLEKNREVKSLERLSSKGLASAAQLEQQTMQRRRAELQVERLEKQIAGLRRVYPDYFAP